MFNIGGSEMVVLAVLALLVFGPEGLPGIIKNVMRTVNAVKIAARDFQTEVKTALDTENERQDLAKRRRSYVDKPQRDPRMVPAWVKRVLRSICRATPRSVIFGQPLPSMRMLAGLMSR